MRATAVIVLGLLLPLGFAGPTPPLGAAEEAGHGLAVEIAVPARLGKRTLELSSFSLVVVNRSDADLKVWRNWCSWGWFQPSLEFRNEKGKVVRVVRKDRPWDKNYPDFWTMAPGEPFVLSLNLTDSVVWKCDVPIESLKGKSLDVRAVFAAEPDEASKEDRVWTGRTASPWRTYDVR